MVLRITCGGAGGVINALLTDNGFILPSKVSRIWRPGFLSSVMVGAFLLLHRGPSTALEQPWSFAHATERSAISLTFSALAGAFLVGVAGSRWLTNEVDKRLLKESVREAAKKSILTDETER